ncbi:nuclear transport factor 2 family protein [Aspergillus lucknowensis]|uniref:SnoaL-like domain-containing protein n=1 Tax=Aspergillus lucknowensis TaxID=176173 RepID=A0ABR4M4S4_9EURO
MDKQPIALPSLTPREAVLDAYYRIAWALDYNDWELFQSGWTTQSEPALHIEEHGRHHVGIEEIKTGLFDVVSELDTQHIATNARVHLEPGAKTARMWIMALNQHFRKGQQAKAGSPRLWGGNQYMFDLVEEDGVWKVQTWSVRMGWNEGDLSIVGR